MPVMKIRDVKPGEPFIEVESNDGSVALKVPKKILSIILFKLVI